MDARQRLLDALAEVERLDVACSHESESLAWAQSHQDRDLLLRDLLPTLAALREVVEMHSYSMDDGVEYCDKCHYCKPCPTLRTLTRQFEEE